MHYDNRANFFAEIDDQLPCSSEEKDDEFQPLTCGVIDARRRDSAPCSDAEEDQQFGDFQGASEAGCCDYNQYACASGGYDTLQQDERAAWGGGRQLTAEDEADEKLQQW